jgi:hypothetical protein
MIDENAESEALELDDGGALLHSWPACGHFAALDTTEFIAWVSD